jgi:phosphate transport system substrate-binding protein
MKRLFFVIVILATLSSMMFAAGCNKEQEILVVSREKGSGTREIFDSLVKNESGSSLQDAELTKDADQQSTNERVRTLVATTDSGIGYVSLAALNSDVKTIAVEGIPVSQETVRNGSYMFTRSLYIVTRKNQSLSEAANDFMHYLRSSDAQDIVGVKLVKRESTVAYTPPQQAVNGRIVIRGATTVDPLMDDLIEDYKKITGEKTRGVSFNKDTQGSAGALTAVENDCAGETIGLYSGMIAPDDIQKFDFYELALDGIAIIVNKDNPIENITTAQLYKIYTGEIKKFSAL